MSLIKSKRRVADHGEVFTPERVVDAMLDLVKEDAERIDARFLEPGCGSGNFLERVAVNPDNSVRPDGAFHQWRKDPPR